jgi:hypothetical protein
MKERPLTLPILVVGTAISAFVRYLVVYYAGVGTWWFGLCVGAILWTGFGAIATLFAMSIASLPMSLWLYNYVSQLVAYSALGLIYSVWK